MGDGEKGGESRMDGRRGEGRKRVEWMGECEKGDGE